MLKHKKMMQYFKSGLLGLTCLLSLNLYANPALTIGELQIDQTDFSWLYHYWVADKKISEQVFADKLVESLLVYRYTQKQTPEALQPSAVDYQLDWYLEQQLAAFCRAQTGTLALPLTRNTDNVVPANVSEHFPSQHTPSQHTSSQHTSSQNTPSQNSVDTRQLVKYFKLESRLGFELTTKQKDALKNNVVAQSYDPIAPNSMQRFNLAELFERLSVQDKQGLFQGDATIIDREVKLWGAYREGCAGINPQRLNGVRSILAALHSRNRLLDYYAVSEEQHGDNNSLEKYKQQVTPEAIERYYQTNKDEFKFIKSVRYDAHDFDQYEQAERFRSRFSESAANTTAEWHDKERNWLSDLAFNLPKETLSSPIRSPAGRYVVVYVFDKRYDIYAADSETVNYIAGRKLARNFAVKYYQSLLQQLKRAQQVIVNV